MILNQGLSLFPCKLVSSVFVFVSSLAPLDVGILIAQIVLQDLREMLLLLLISVAYLPALLFQVWKLIIIKSSKMYCIQLQNHTSSLLHLCIFFMASSFQQTQYQSLFRRETFPAITLQGNKKIPFSTRFLDCFSGLLPILVFFLCRSWFLYRKQVR